MLHCSVRLLLHQLPFGICKWSVGRKKTILRCLLCFTFSSYSLGVSAVLQLSFHTSYLENRAADTGAVF